jgi:hypothetical protein
MRPAWIALGTFGAVVLAGALFFALRITEGPAPKTARALPEAPAVALESASDSYHAGVHTIKGTLTLPTACTPFTATTSQSADGIRVDIASQPDDGICLALPSSKQFSVTADGDVSSSVSIFVNGALATTTP